MKRITVLWTFLLSLLSTSSLLAEEQVSQQSDENQSIAVLDFAADGVDASLAKLLTRQATNALDKLGVFHVISSEDIQSMLSAEALKQVVGCNENSCLAELAGAVGATYVVTGSIGKLGESYQLSLTLIDQAQAKTLDRVVRQDQVPVAELPNIAALSARQLVRTLLKAKQGSLELVINENGADIIIDDSLVGVSPLSKALKLAQGPHRIKIDKKGFLTFKQDFEVHARDSTGLSVQLIPSAEFRQAYKSRNGTLRNLFWLSSGVSVLALAGTATAIYFNTQQQAEARQLVQNSPDVFGANPDAPQILDAQATQVADYNRLQSDSTMSSISAYSAIALASVSGIAAAVFWFVGEDPGRYE